MAAPSRILYFAYEKPKLLTGEDSSGDESGLQGLILIQAGDQMNKMQKSNF
jgi:hypothetical protein